MTPWKQRTRGYSVPRSGGGYKSRSNGQSNGKDNYAGKTPATKPMKPTGSTYNY